MAYDTVEPFGDSRADLRMSIMASSIVNATCGAKTKPRDFMPKFGATRRKQTLEEMKAIPALFRRG